MKLKPPSRSAGRGVTTTITKTTNTRPSVAAGASSPSSFFALKPTGLVATPPSSTSRTFDFDKYDEYNEDDDENDDEIDDENDYYSDDDEDPTIYSRADWYD